MADYESFETYELFQKTIKNLTENKKEDHRAKLYGSLQNFTEQNMFDTDDKVAEIYRYDKENNTYNIIVLKGKNKTYRVYLYGLPILSAASEEGALAISLWLNRMFNDEKNTMLVRNYSLVSDGFIFVDVKSFRTELRGALRNYGFSTSLWEDDIKDTEDANYFRQLISQICSYEIPSRQFAFACMDLHKELKNLSNKKFDVSYVNTAKNTSLTFRDGMSSDEKLFASIIYTMLDDTLRPKFQRCITDNITLNKAFDTTSLDSSTIEEATENCDETNIQNIISVLLKLDENGKIPKTVKTKVFGYKVLESVKSRKAKTLSAKQSYYLALLYDELTDKHTKDYYKQLMQNESNADVDDLQTIINELKYAIEHQDAIISIWTDQKRPAQKCFTIANSVIERNMLTKNMKYYVDALLDAVKIVKGQ